MRTASLRAPGQLILKVSGVALIALGVLGVLFSVLSLLDADFIANLSSFNDSFLGQIPLLDRRLGSLALTFAALTLLARSMLMLVIGTIVLICAGKSRFARMLIVLLVLQLIVVIIAIVASPTIIRFSGLIPPIAALFGAFQNAMSHRK